MNAITSIYLDVVRQGPVKQRITAKQGDVGTRYITVSLTANGKMLTIPQDVKDVSGKIPKDNEFITAPIIFEAEDILVTLEREDTVVLALKMSELRSVNGVVFGKLGIKEDEHEE